MALPWDFDSATTPTIYHYTSADAAVAMAENRSIWLSEYTGMNDASEFVYARDRLLALLRGGRIKIGIPARLCLIAAIEGLTQRTGLVLGSLTARGDDLSQWRTYASDAKGCVLGVDAAYLEHDAGVAIRTVLYDESQVERLLCSALEVLEEQYTDDPSDVETLVDYGRRAAIDLFNIKHPSFADEREIRIARMLIRADDGSLSDIGGNRTDASTVPAMTVAERVGGFGVTKYVSLPLSRRDGSNAIISVGLGTMMAAPDRVRYRAIFESLGLTVWQSSLPYRVAS